MLEPVVIFPKSQEDLPGGILCQSLLEVRAVNAAFFRTADFVNHRKFESPLRVTGGSQAGDVDIVAEAKGKVIVIKLGGKDEGIRGETFLEVVGQTHPSPQLKRLGTGSGIAQ